jgi:hypothetical protein
MKMQHEIERIPERGDERGWMTIGWINTEKGW